MGRPQKFDRTDVLNRALTLFWDRGYTATSIHDLTRETGLSKASLYNSFGNKDQFFRTIIEHYIETRQRNRLASLTSVAPGILAIETFFDGIADAANGPDRKLGCLLTNTAVELGPHVEEVENRLSEAFHVVENALKTAIENGMKDGSICSNARSDQLARTLASSIHGLRVLSRCGTDVEAIRETVTVLLSLIPRPDHS